MKIFIFLLLAILPTGISASSYLSPLWRCSVSSDYIEVEADAPTSSKAHQIALQLCWDGTPPHYCCCNTNWCRKIRDGTR